MGKLIDSVAVWLACVALQAMTGFQPYSIAGMLASAIAVCLSMVVRLAPVRMAMLVVFLAACVVLPCLGAFLPVAACLCMLERNAVAKGAWLVAWAAMLPTSEPAYAGALLCLCGAASLLAWKTERGEQVRHALFDSWDAASARSSFLQQRNREMAQAQAVAQMHATDAHAAAVAQEEAPDPLDGLTERERQVAVLVAEGKDNHAIAEELFLSEGTVRNYISAILSKKQLKNRTQLAVLCLRLTD